MNLAHLHLLLNHFPAIGFAIGLCLFIAALWLKSADLRRVSLVVFFLIAVIAIPAYLSGNAAETQLCPDGQCPEDVSPSVIRDHEDAALVAFLFMMATGFFAWLGLWQLRRMPRLPAWNVAAILAPALAGFFLMGLAADEGSEIRHPEIEAAETAESGEPAEAAPEVPQEPEPAAAAEPGEKAEETPAREAPPAEATPEAEAAGAAQTAEATEIQEDAPVERGLARTIGDHVSGASGIDWLWPAAETLHFMGLCLIFTVVLLVNLRLLGMAKSLSFPALYQLLPLGMLGFVINLITGMLFFIGSPGQYTNNGQFHWKIAFLVVAGVNALYFVLFDDVWKVESGKDAPVTAKFAAAMAIVLWVGILFFGHMLPFLGTSF
jgi:hypothetical protein